MELFWTLLFAALALGWIAAGAVLVAGMLRLPRLAGVPPAPSAAALPGSAPLVSILVAGRDEARRLEPALRSLVAQDLERLEVVFVDDRSRDATGAIADALAAEHARLRVVHLRELPPGWLGKTHALHEAYRRSRGEWLVFTDADIRFAPDVVTRTLALAEREGWDHVTLLAGIELEGFWETLAVTTFGLFFALDRRPWRVADPRSRASLGVGAFQLLRRSTYEAIGTHRALALEVLDDVMLGELVKRAGFRSGVAVAEERLTLRWYEGLGAIVRGLTKNAFAYTGFRVWLVLGELTALLSASVLPVAAVCFVPQGARVAALAAVLAPMLLHGAVARAVGASPLVGLAHPLGALLLAWISLRSTAVVLARGGVEWRGTFHPLRELRRRG